MPTTYQYAIGQNNAAGLATLDPQPATNGPIVFKRRIAADGIARNVGGGTLVFNYTAAYTADFEALLTTYGVTLEDPAVGCTVRLRDFDDSTTYTNYNAICTLLIPERVYQGWLNIRFELTQVTSI